MSVGALSPNQVLLFVELSLSGNFIRPTSTLKSALGVGTTYIVL